MGGEVDGLGPRSRLDFSKLSEPQRKLVRSVMEPKWHAQRGGKTGLDRAVHRVAAKKFEAMEEDRRMNAVEQMQIPDKRSKFNAVDPKSDSPLINLFSAHLPASFYEKLIKEREEAFEQQILIERREKKRESVWFRAKERLAEYLKKRSHPAE